MAELAAFDSRKQGFMAPKPTLSLDEIEAVMEQEASYLARVEQCEEILRRMRALEGRQRQLQGQAEQLAQYRALTTPVEDVGDTRDTAAFLGSVAAPELPALKEAVAQQPLAALQVIAVDAAHGYIPVSYTHLDVYKRQVVVYPLVDLLLLQERISNALGWMISAALGIQAQNIWIAVLTLALLAAAMAAFSWALMRRAVIKG